MSKIAKIARIKVVPLVGTWIEIPRKMLTAIHRVVPLVGTWIEISIPNLTR